MDSTKSQKAGHVQGRYGGGMMGYDGVRGWYGCIMGVYMNGMGLGHVLCSVKRCFGGETDQ